MFSLVSGFLLSVVSSLLATHLWTESSEINLKPSDFDIQTVSSRHAAQKPNLFVPKESLHVIVTIGSVMIDSTLALEERGIHAYLGGRSPWQALYYPSKRMNITFQEKTTIQSLNGKKISARIPLQALYPKSRNELRIWIKGRELTLIPTDEGSVKHILTNKDLGIGG